jgi:NADPH:quinone reductase-like Zn-dependent oxidoreductase
LLIKVDASTINPSDRARLTGNYSPVKLPSIMGLEGTGKVISANGEDIQNWVGKRVCFLQKNSGSWGEYAISTPLQSFPIDEDVPLTTAASGIVNPLTVIGMIEIFN